MTITTNKSSNTIVTRSALIPAGQPFNATTDGTCICICFLEPYGGDFYQCQQFMQNSTGDIYFDSNNESDQILLLTNIYSKKLPENIAYEIMVEHFFQRSKITKQEHSVDDRIVKVVEFIKNNAAGNHTNQYLADLVGMSAHNLRQVFKKTTKIPIRRYRLWHRLFVTANFMALGYTLTDASIAAGFSDSSHFSHVFRSMLGIKPSFVLKRSEDISLFTQQISNSSIGDVLNFPTRLKIVN